MKTPKHWTRGNDEYMQLAEEHGMVESVACATNEELLVMIKQAILSEIGICTRLWAVEELFNRLETKQPLLP